jgi:hypothetical protein
VTSGLRIAGFHLTSSAGRVLHIVSGSETLGMTGLDLLYQAI